MSELECRSELTIRERRGELSVAEQAALEAHLVHCVSCRLTRRLGADFEECGVLETADGARVARLSSLAVEWAASERGVPVRGRVRTRSRLALLLVAACTLLVAVGASATYAVIKAQGAAPAPVALSVQAPPDAMKSRAPALVVERTPVAPAAEPQVTPPASVPAAPLPSAGELLEQANRARRSGSNASAVALFRELGRRFPSSAEARLGEVRLGGLLLEQGQPRAALGEFDRHLARGGGLAPEALYGKARAYAALGDAGGERAAWASLVRDYPGSPYVGQAERRLGALSGSATPTTK